MMGAGELWRAPLVLDGCAKKLRRQLEFELLDPHSIGVAEKETDHTIGEYAIDEGIDDRSDFFFPAQLFKETCLTSTHAPFTTVGYIIPICNRAASDILLDPRAVPDQSIVTP
jgi:hypothetical protein